MTNTCIRTMICSYDDYFGFVATDGVHASKLPELARLGTIVEQIVLNPARIQ